MDLRLTHTKIADKVNMLCQYSFKEHWHGNHFFSLLIFRNFYITVKDFVPISNVITFGVGQLVSNIIKISLPLLEAKKIGTSKKLF